MAHVKGLYYFWGDAQGCVEENVRFDGKAAAWPPSVSFADTAYAAEPFCRCATSPHTVGSHPSRGAYGASGTPPPTFKRKDCIRI